jgi:SAM-dependent methyltransferase
MLASSSRSDRYWTRRRARAFNQAMQISDFPAQAVKALEPALAGCRSVLDVGAGVGALTLSLAKAVDRVTALEPSPAMMTELQENLARLHLDNVTCVPAAWGEVELPPHDLILLANVRPLFNDLRKFLTEAQPLAQHGMALVRNAGPATEKFYYGELYPLLLGRPYPLRDDYLTTITLLHGHGIYANVRIIHYNFDQPFADFRQAVEFWTEELKLADPEQERRLADFLQARLQRVGDCFLAPMRRRSAVLWWQVSPTEPE